MSRNITTSILLLFILVIAVCGIYPVSVWFVGQTFFPFQANGSMLQANDGKIVGSKLIAQAFTKDEYFHPRPSAADFNAAASASSALAASNYALRDRIAHALGPIVKYKNEQLVGPDIEKWAQAKIQDYNKQHPGKPLSSLEIQSMFFDQWRQEHPDVELLDIPSDYVTTSASGLDPHISLKNAEMQLDRIVNAWAVKLKRDAVDLRNEINKLLYENSQAPLNGLFGERIVNVLEINLMLQKKYG